MLDNRFALLFIRGERPVKDLKYDILKHPNVKLSTDGGAQPYTYGYEDRSVAALSYELPTGEETVMSDAPDDEDRYEVYSSEEIEELLKEMEETENEE